MHGRRGGHAPLDMRAAAQGAQKVHDKVGEIKEVYGKIGEIKEVEQSNMLGHVKCLDFV